MRLTAILLLLACAGCKIDQGNYSESPNSSPAAKVAAVMAANDITLPQVVAYLYGNGWTVVHAPLPSAHWKPANPGSAPIAYYVVEYSAAIGDTAMQHYLPSTAGPYRMRVKAVDVAGLVGVWSDLGWSDNGDGSNALPGVGVEP